MIHAWVHENRLNPGSISSIILILKNAVSLAAIWLKYQTKNCSYPHQISNISLPDSAQSILNRSWFCKRWVKSLGLDNPRLKSFIGSCRCWCGQWSTQGWLAGKPSCPRTSSQCSSACPPCLGCCRCQRPACKGHECQSYQQWSGTFPGIACRPGCWHCWCPPCRFHPGTGCCHSQPWRLLLGPWQQQRLLPQRQSAAYASSAIPALHQRQSQQSRCWRRPPTG